ncbi:MAG: hypothetical protein OXH68_06890 [Gammaproteobacteria bacterium]|nr:hypothetical protein [Gammaproteobacteria bacterium]
MRDVTEFSVGDIIKTSFAVYFNNLASFLPLSLVAFAPSFAVVLFFDSSSLHNPLVLDPTVQNPVNAEFWEFVMVGTRESFVELLCLIWLQAGLAFGVVRHLRGASPGFLETFVQSLRMLLPAVLVTVVVTIATGIGLVLLLVPGIVIALVLWVAVPAAVVERSGLRALPRSARLTDGYKGQIFGLALILLILQMVAGSVVVLLASTVVTSAFVLFVVMELCSVVLSGIWATAVSVTYHDLRVLREGVDTRAISQVFE